MRVIEDAKGRVISTRDYPSNKEGLAQINADFNGFRSQGIYCIIAYRKKPEELFYYARYMGDRLISVHQTCHKGSIKISKGHRLEEINKHKYLEKKLLLDRGKKVFIRSRKKRLRSFEWKGKYYCSRNVAKYRLEEGDELISFVEFNRVKKLWTKSSLEN